MEVKMIMEKTLDLIAKTLIAILCIGILSITTFAFIGCNINPNEPDDKYEQTDKNHEDEKDDNNQGGDSQTDTDKGDGNDNNQGGDSQTDTDKNDEADKDDPQKEPDKQEEGDKDDDKQDDPNNPDGGDKQLEIEYGKTYSADTPEFKQEYAKFIEKIKTLLSFNIEDLSNTNFSIEDLFLDENKDLNKEINFRLYLKLNDSRDKTGYYYFSNGMIELKGAGHEEIERESGIYCEDNNHFYIFSENGKFYKFNKDSKKAPSYWYKDNANIVDELKNIINIDFAELEKVEMIDSMFIFKLGNEKNIEISLGKMYGNDAIFINAEDFKGEIYNFGYININLPQDRICDRTYIPDVKEFQEKFDAYINNLLTNRNFRADRQYTAENPEEFYSDGEKSFEKTNQNGEMYSIKNEKNEITEAYQKPVDKEREMFGIPADVTWMKLFGIWPTLKKFNNEIFTNLKEMSTYKFNLEDYQYESKTYRKYIDDNTYIDIGFVEGDKLDIMEYVGRNPVNHYRFSELENISIEMPKVYFESSRREVVDNRSEEEKGKTNGDGKVEFKEQGSFNPANVKFNNETEAIEMQIKIGDDRSKQRVIIGNQRKLSRK